MFWTYLNRERCTIEIGTQVKMKQKQAAILRSHLVYKRAGYALAGASELPMTIAKIINEYLKSNHRNSGRLSFKILQNNHKHEKLFECKPELIIPR
jgi:Neuraminidase (sialidase)